MHPHAIEAARQISGDIFGKDEADELFRGASQPHLLHEPYMSAEGAAGMLGQTLADVARKVDQGAEACGTLESPEFEAFRALVSSVYVGSLQRRVDYVEKKEGLQAQVSEKASEMLPKERLYADADKGWGSNPHQRNKKYGGSDELHAAKRQNRDKNGRGGRTDDGKRTGCEDKTSGSSYGEACAGHQACSGDIARALVAIAMGEGFELFAGTAMDEDGASAHAKGGTGKDSSSAPRVPAKDRRRAFGGGAKDAGRTAEGRAEVGGDRSSFRAEQQLLQQERDNLAQAAAELRYLSEDAAIFEGAGAGGGELPATQGSIENGAGSEGGEGRFPGLQWLAPHIIGRSIPMELRYIKLVVCYGSSQDAVRQWCVHRLAYSFRKSVVHRV